MLPTDPHSLIVLIGVGLVAGWLAGVIVQGGGFGAVGNIIIGIIGAFIGFYVFRFFHISLPWEMGALGKEIVVAAIGSIILLFILGFIRS